MTNGKFILTSILDHKTNRYGFVQTHQHVVDASRLFKDIIDREDSNIAKYPQDFSLQQLGTFDPETGVITPNEPLHHICNALDLIQSVDS